MEVYGDNAEYWGCVWNTGVHWGNKFIIIEKYRRKAVLDKAGKCQTLVFAWIIDLWE